jgi:transposase
MREPSQRNPDHGNGTQTQPQGERIPRATLRSYQRKARARQRKASKGEPRGSTLSLKHPDAAGIDVGARVHYVAVPEGRAEPSVRSFGAYTAQLDELVRWLKSCGIKTVALESTGVYWIALYQKLEAAGLEVVLVDARRAKHVPGRKSDVQDCQWLQQLHSYGLLAPAFRPEDAICRLRTLQRHRKSLVECAAMWVLHLQKALTQMNLHLHHVLTDLTGQSGLAVLEAILAGERNPRTLAGLVSRRVKQSPAQIEAALTGDYRAEALFVVEQALQSYHHLQQQIAQCDLAIEKQVAALGDCPTPPPTGEPSAPVAAAAPPPPSRRRKTPTAQEVSLAGHLKRILGVDLTTIPGLNVLAVLTLLSEIGTDLSKWRHEKAFASWLGLSPTNKVSGQRVLSSRTRQVNNRAATILRLAAVAVGKTDTPLGAFYRRKRAQLGGPKAITATARKLACLIYRLIKAGQGYQEGDARAYELKYKDQILRALRKRAAGFGFELVELPKAA